MLNSWTSSADSSSIIGCAPRSGTNNVSTWRTESCSRSDSRCTTSFWPTSLRSRISSTRATPSRSRRQRPNVSPTSRSRMRESGGMNVWSRSTIARRLVTRSLRFSGKRAVTYSIMGSVFAGDASVDRWKRYEKPLPGHRIQIDVKFIAPLQGSRKKHYQFTAIDDCTRILVLRIYDRLNQQSAIRFLDYVLEKLPVKVEVIQIDHGAEFGSQFHYHVLDRGIGHVYIKPAIPRLNG